MVRVQTRLTIPPKLQVRHNLHQGLIHTHRPRRDLIEEQLLVVLIMCEDVGSKRFRQLLVVVFEELYELLEAALVYHVEQRAKRLL